MILGLTCLAIFMAVGFGMVTAQLNYFRIYQEKANPERPVLWSEVSQRWARRPFDIPRTPPDLGWLLVKDASPVQDDPDVIAARGRIIRWRWILLLVMLVGPIVVLGCSILADAFAHR